MSKKIEEKLNKIVAERAEEIGKKIITESNEFREAGEKANKIFEEIKHLLPADNKVLLYEYDNAIGIRSAIAEETMYKQGVKDGIWFLND